MAISIVMCVWFGTIQFHEQLSRLCVEVWWQKLFLHPSIESNFSLFYVPCIEDIHLYLQHINGGDNFTNFEQVSRLGES